MPASRMLSAISFGVFCRSAPSTSAIMRSRKEEPGADGDAHHDPVGEHRRAAGDGGAVAARLADHRRGLAGDGRLVDRGDALDDLAVARDDVAGLDQHDVAGAQLERRDRSYRARGCLGSASRLAVVVGARRAQASAWARPRPSATASAKLANSTVNQSQAAICPVNAAGCPATRSRTNSTVTSAATTSVTKITGLRDQHARVELAEGVGDGAPDRAPGRTTRRL